MTQRPNPYLQNRFEDNSEQPTTPRRQFRVSAPSDGFRQRITNKFRSNPVMAGAALMIAGAAFATILITSYPSGNDGDVPIVQADADSFREAPTGDTASAAPAGDDSTIFSTLRSSGQMNESAPIENLLDQEQPVEKPAPVPATAAVKPATTTTKTVAATEPAAGAPATTTTTTTATTVDAAPPAMPDEATTPTQTGQLEHAAGESPDTLAFVRSVLDKKDGKSVADATTTTATTTSMATTTSAAPDLNAVTPASGGTFAPGTYYVQLGSVTSRPGADTEFKKMQKNFTGTGLESASYRVQEATVADKGTFYRIQAGPMSKESAGKLCDSIKAKSPGGCLIVQQ